MIFIARKIKALLTSYRDSRLTRLVQRVLSSSEPTNTALAESEFESLQRSYNGVPEYGYEDLDCWGRACDRSKAVLKLDESVANSWRVLEFGCGDALTSYLLKCYGWDAWCTDLEDWRNPRAQTLPFEARKLEEGLSWDANSFDLVCSWNTVEHLVDPTACIQEVVRLLKPGGLAYFDFGPLYGSPWGLHAYRSLYMPYPQFLFSESFVRARLRELGIRDLGRERTELQPLNGWSVAKFNALWASSGCDVLSLSYGQRPENLDLVLKYPRSFQGRGLTTTDLVSSHCTVVLRKRT